ncbi:unnamed protein product [Cyclocybe aegerita]|uniref:Uncharacterized protein n=1 Tax=Cyclocybe aegerita TaxID=1973307 RepID=A0A8S0X7P1_CYCAE|nr:unnamed protein product [Cyclocybe aegerita]
MTSSVADKPGRCCFFPLSFDFDLLFPPITSTPHVITDLKALPDEATILKAAALEVLDAKGEKVKFGSIIEGQKTVVGTSSVVYDSARVFHLTLLKLCPHLPLIDQACQAYVEQLASVPQDSLTQAGTKIVIIGCGEAAAILHYTETTKFTGAIYADPSRELYHALGMTIENLQRTPAGEERPSYLRGMSLLGGTLRSIWRGPVRKPTLIGKQGNISQLGGEFIFGPGNKCSFASRMKHTEDHIEVADLMKEAGVVLP